MRRRQADPGNCAPEDGPEARGNYPPALFINFLTYEITYLNITANLITLKSRGFFAQAGKPVPPSSLLSGELSGARGTGTGGRSVGPVRPHLFWVSPKIFQGHLDYESQSA